jgi:oxalate decarboxylase
MEKEVATTETTSLKSDHYAEISLNEWMALKPPELVRGHLNLDDATMAARSNTKLIVGG